MVFGSYGWSSAGLELTLRSAMQAGVLYEEVSDVESPVDNKESEDTVLTLDLVDIRRRGHRLINQLSLVVTPGDSLAVMGPSGAGKTTLLRVVAGLTPHQAGDITRPGHRVSMVFQDPRLLPWRTALDNVALVAEGPNSQELAAHWLERVGMGEAQGVFPAALSGGMRQRVAIARALAAEAELVLVDEPFANLDLSMASRLRQELIEHLRSSESTSIWVTHDPLDAATAADRTLVLAGPPSGAWQIVDHPRAGLSTDEIVGRLESTLHQISCPENPASP